MKAKITNECFYSPTLKIGETVEIVPGMETDAEGIWNVPMGRLFLCKKEDGTFAYTTPANIQLLPGEDDTFDWASFRREAAKDAMCGILSAGNDWQHLLTENRHNGDCSYPAEIAQFAIACADGLIKQLNP